MEEDDAPANAFSILKGDHQSSGQTGNFRYQRTTEPSRQTIWRIQKKKDALKAAASGSTDIRSMFARQPPIPQPPPEESRADVIRRAIGDLEKKLCLARAGQSHANGLNVQTNIKYRAVLHFLYAQRKCQNLTRRELSRQVATTFNRGKYFAETIVTLERRWIKEREIVEGRQGIHTKISSLFNDEAVRNFVMEFVKSKGEEITSSLLARAVSEYVGSQPVQAQFEGLLEAASEERASTSGKRGIKIEAARRWLKSMGYSWRTVRKNVYVDGHEREDVVEHRKKFLQTFKDLEPRIAKWDENGELIGGPSPPGGGRWLVIVTHDESTFQVNDGRRQMWLLKDNDPLRPKGVGKGIMVSEFLTPLGRLQVPCSVSDEELQSKAIPRLATRTLEYGHDNFWNGEKMADQTLNTAMPLFELAFPPDRFQGLFLFDNATNHRVMAPDALDVRKMNLGPGGKQPVMRDGWNSLTNSPQKMTDANGVPIGIRQTLVERGLWPGRGLRLECGKGQHSSDNSCCARKLLGAQPDFASQRGYIQEKIEERGHLVMFYPKFHPELNFIEYFWAAAKRFARENCDYTIRGLRSTVHHALESVRSDTIRKYHYKTLRIMSAYREGFSMGTKDFEEIVYKSHRRVRQ